MSLCIEKVAAIECEYMSARCRCFPLYELRTSVWYPGLNKNRWNANIAVARGIAGRVSRADEAM